MIEQETEQEIEQQPIEISPEAAHILSQKVREWSGWSDATLSFGKPVASPYADTHIETHHITANPEALILNPNRVLLTVTPFRLRQEAVLTGALLHEAGHARHSRWQPRSAEAFANLRHANGDPVTKQALALARLMEEPRIEGKMAKNADKIGAPNLGWTMRATAAHLLPRTELSADGGQQVMDVITSWALRAGRQLAIAQHTDYDLPTWVMDFNTLLHETLVAWLSQREDIAAQYQASRVKTVLTDMACDLEDTGTRMLDRAQGVLSILFPETDGDADDAPMPGEPACGGGEADGSESGDSEGSDDAEDGEGGAEDEGSEGEGSEGEGSEGEGSEGEGSEGEGSEEGDDEPEEGESEDSDSLANALADLEETSEEQVEQAAASDAKESPLRPQEYPAGGAGVGRGRAITGGWRSPTPEERDVSRNAGKFLRSLIDPSETSKVTFSESPSPSVDAAQMAIWKAGGQRRDPKFFLRTHRNTEPAPPVKIAILVDVSRSMRVLQRPSALLSWALSNAAIDLRNFAGRGVQVESCLIHWGVVASVIQGVGQPLPGLREVDCNQGTNAMGDALYLVEQQMPGFFTAPERPENRLIVHFTDWMLGGDRGVVGYTDRALNAGVNMLTVLPERYSATHTHTSLPRILEACSLPHRGKSHAISYSESHPERVWGEAAALLK